MPGQPTIFVVDDDAAVRESLSQLIQTMHMHVRCFESADTFLEHCRPDATGCVIADFRMPGMNGVQLQRAMADRDIPLPVIIVTGHADIPLCVQAMKQGAIDFLEKPYRPEHLRQAIQRAIRIDRQRRQDRTQSQVVTAKLAELTSQERAVLNGILAGKPNKTLAAELDISLRTVQFRRASLMHKLDVSSRAELIQVVTSAHQPRE